MEGSGLSQVLKSQAGLVYQKAGSEINGTVDNLIQPNVDFNSA